MISKIERINGILSKERIEGLLIVDSSNLFYLTGFHAPACYGLLSGSGMELFVPPLLYSQAAGAVKGIRVTAMKDNAVFSLKACLKRAGIRRLAFEEAKLSLAMYRRMENGMGRVEMIAKDGMIEDLRVIKDENEIKLMRKSAGICMSSLEYMGKRIKTGMKEKNIAARLEYFMRQRGAEKSSFDCIVASGENTAYPHHIPGERKVRGNDAVLIDCGCTYGGYASDLTRVIFLDKIHRYGRMRKIYDAVVRAKEKATGIIRPGIKCRDVDRIARNVIEDAGFGKYFTHGTGHGLGIDVHERPYFNSKSGEILKPGMVCTVEPGVYIPGEGGVRLEDMILVTEKGHEVL